MAEAILSAPVAFFLFNRPETTARVFAEIRRARPRRLLLIADGPRPDRPGEAERCAAARAVVQQVDWPCEVSTNFAEANLGCRRRLSSGLDWVFATAPEAIVLEDDCLPHPTFFRFCQELLERYRDDERVMHIGGDNFQFGRRRTPDSYYFSRYPHVWGWASWRRAWRHYDVEMRRWPERRRSGWLRGRVDDPLMAWQWTRNFDRAARGELDTWDYQWVFACWTQDGLSVVPEVNLVSNIGFNAQGSRTVVAHPLGDLPASALDFPLRHPARVERHAAADRYTHWSQFSPASLRARAANVLARWRRQ